MHKLCSVVFAGSAILGTMSAQGIERRASIGRGPGGLEGCTVVVVVDGVAEVEIRGDHATMRDISGQPPQFREFECSRPMPTSGDVRFTAESGRGRQEMIRSVREGGEAVIRIEDPQSGAGEYRFRLTWGGDGDRRDQGAMDRGRGGDRPDQAANDRGRDGDRRDGDYQQERDRFFQGEGWRRNLFQRVRMDVEHVERSTIPFTGDRARLTRTITELNELQAKLGEGRYDERQLDEVMGALRAVVQENRLQGRDRDVLSDDLNRLREFRDHHDDYGARYQRN
jgi:hypothetical protein